MIIANVIIAFFWTSPKTQTKQLHNQSSRGFKVQNLVIFSWGQKVKTVALHENFQSRFQTPILQVHILLWSYLLHIFCLCPSSAQGWEFSASAHKAQPGPALGKPAGSALQRLQRHPPTVWMKVLGQPKNDHIGQDVRLLKRSLLFLMSFSPKPQKNWDLLCYMKVILMTSD